MTKNEQLFKILDAKFPGEFSYRLERSSFVPTLRSNLKNCSILTSDINDAFWLADKVGLFEYESGYLLCKGMEGWCIIDNEANLFGRGGTPQEAIVNAIIAIYGDK